VSSAVVCLGGPGWSVREALGMTWKWYVDAPLPAAGNNVAAAATSAASAPGWIDAAVPGTVVGDLVRAGEIDDPYVARRSRGAEWTATRHWVYRRALDVPMLDDDERVVLDLDGVAPGGAVFVDGAHVGRVDGMYHRHHLDITPLVTPGARHRLCVVVDPVPDCEPQVSRTDLVSQHVPRLNYGWDFCPRLPHQGIWRSVRLRIGRTYLCDVTVAARLDADMRQGTVRVEGHVEGTVSAKDSVVVVVTGDTGQVAQSEVGLEAAAAGGGQRFAVDATVERPRLWWPNGHGEPALYSVEVRVTSDASATWSDETGFRRIRMVPNPGGPEGALPYTAVVNDVPVSLVGWNWAPADAQHGEVTPARVRHLVGLAACSGARLLRVWGGGLVETDDFYRECDRAGLLVWQEFSQSSSGFQNAPADDDAYIQLMRSEARAVIPPRTHHPCLLMWGGGNELEVDGVPLDEAVSPVLAALGAEVHALDPDRHWVPTSPSGPAFFNRTDTIAVGPDKQHDVHGPWEHQGLAEHYGLYNAGCSLAHTEFGVEGMTNLRTLEALVPDRDRWPATRANPVYRHLGEWWINEPVVQESFGHRLTNLVTLQRASQVLQATGLAYAVESDRRRAPRCSMVLPWQLNESFPNAWCTSAVDYHGEPKPAFHAVRRAFADDRTTVQVDRAAWPPGTTPAATAWVWSAAGVAPGSTLTARLLDGYGNPLAEERRANLPGVSDPTAVVHLVAPQHALDALPERALLLWETTWTGADGEVIDRTVEIAARGPDWSALLDLDAAALAVRVGCDEGRRAARVEVVHRAGPAVVGLALTDARRVDDPGWVTCDGDVRPLLPGEQRAHTVRWDADVDRPVLRLESWNSEHLAIDLLEGVNG
jgi:beta-mannosidase